ncbi:polysaccharide deacetylase family protein [Paenibacillus validus]|uniref:polysaccharide deacetylase family protein n=1 Tax=Paenibacillus TaxID=44249 RepID=UPI001FCF90E4|nr:polysaccharide deacetylase family protein [Paenibacillus validus]MED4600607.1 polysaccharide deacetylase family protein [Paenibacillus validus]MED4605616.1 polysaccharide deacetylase family protein [Paenibacillus validus]
MLRRYGLLWLISILSVLFLAPGFVHSGGSSVYYTDKVAVLAYHHIDDDQRGDVTITSKRFREQLRDLRNRGYHFITLREFRSFMKGGSIPPNSVLVTFDDGYESFYTKAFPILKEMRVPAVNFVITEDLDHPDRTLIPTLSREQIRRMISEMKEIEVECHSDSLHGRTPDGGPLLTTKLPLAEGGFESDEQFERRIVSDTRRSLDKLSTLNDGPIDAYAYPFGAYNLRSIELLRQAGIQYAFTTQSGMAERGNDPFQIPRINAGSPYVRMNSLNNMIIHKLYRASP